MQDPTATGSQYADERVEYVEEAETPGDPCTFYFRSAKTTERPAILLQDVADLAALPLVFLATWLSPANVWIWLTKSSALIGQRLVPRNRQHQVRAACESVLGDLDPEEWQALRQNLVAKTAGKRFAVAREFSPKNRALTIEVDGTDKLRNALTERKGAILWVNRFSSYPILAKRALAQEGMPAYAISHACHGYSDSRFAALLINKIQISAENRYLEQRLVFDDGEEIKVQKRALSQLKKGHPVFFTNTSLTGHRFIELPLGRNGRLRMSTGPIAIALRTGAPLFAVSIFEVSPFTSYRVELNHLVVAPTSARGSGKQRTDYQGLARVARASRDIIYDGIRRYPDQSVSILLDE
ncbi:MAG: hypothetical protein AAGF50_13730 [Pseudomonadota bacterium]